MIKESINFYNNKGQNIAGRIYRADPISKTGVVFSHGLFSSKDGYKITSMAEDIVNAGFTLLTFDFSFVGESEGDISELSVLQEVEDLNCAFSFIQDFGVERIHLIGSSMGGVVTLLFASSKRKSIKSLIFIATPIRLESLIPDELDSKDIDLLPDNGMTSLSGVPLNNRFFKELSNIDMNEAISQLNIPSLIIHGGMDEVVDVANANDLSSRLQSNSKLLIIDDGDHNLTRDSDIDLLTLNIVDWMKTFS